MNTRRSTRRLAQLLMIAVLVLSACGGSEDSSGTTVTSSTTTPSVTSAPATTTTTLAVTTSTSTTTSAVPEEMVMVSVFFSRGDGADCSETAEFPRSVPAADPIGAAMVALVAGPTSAEVAGGAGSFFSADTASVVNSVTLADGLLVVDFADLRTMIPNASTSCGSEAMLAQLDNTALQFGDVEMVRYEINGSCDGFANWLQRECFESGRDGRVAVDLPTNERAEGSGCIAPTDSLPDGRWFGFVATATEDEVSFDLACWFTGTAAAQAASEDAEESPPPNDYYIRNASDRLRVVPVAAIAEVAWMPDPGDPETSQIASYQAWQQQLPTRSYRPGIWLRIDDGTVISIEEQYVP